MGMTPQQALEKIGNTLTQVFDLPIKTLCKKEYAILYKFIQENNKKPTATK